MSRGKYEGKKQHRLAKDTPMPRESLPTLQEQRRKLQEQLAKIDQAIEGADDILRTPLNTMTPQEILLALNALRERDMGGTIKEFAEACGVHPTTFSNYMTRSDEIGLRLSHFQAACDLLDLEINLRPKARFTDNDRNR